MEIVKLEGETKIQADSVKEQFAIDVLTGLCAPAKKLSAKYFYDDVGSELFQKITKHPDYYPTLTEFNILNDAKSVISNVIDTKEIDIVELGAGDGHKSKLIIEGFLDSKTKVNYYPIDISEKAMHLLEENIQETENLTMTGIVGEYFQGLNYLRRESNNPKLVLFLGSNIGNFNNVQIQGFLRQLWKNLNEGDHVIIGFDLKKNIDTLLSAYNDSSGITAKFNLNLLERINRELGGNFDLSKFEHFGTYNPSVGAMESFLLSTEKQSVFIEELERSFDFEPYEAIHLEYSFKFLRSEVEQLSENTGFEVENHFSDSKKYFLDSLWKVIKKQK